MGMPNRTAQRPMYGYLRDGYRDVALFPVDLCRGQVHQRAYRGLGGRCWSYSAPIARQTGHDKLLGGAVAHVGIAHQEPAAANPARYRSMCAALRLLEVKDRSVELVAAVRVADPDDMAVVGYPTARAAAAVRRADPLLQSFDALALSTDLGLPRPRTTDRCLSLSIPAAPCVPGCHWHTMPLGAR